MNGRLKMFLHDHAYRARLRNEARLYFRYPRAFGYKSAAVVINQSHQLRLRLHNAHKVSCAVCGWEGNAFETIATFGYLRKNARCPSCGCLERHRAMIEFLKRERWVESGDVCLDVGGIPAFRQWFEARAVNYVSMSLGDPAMVCADIQQMAFADDSFDLILDSHVLEYVANYRQGLREIWRVLRPGGKMLLTEAYDFGKPTTHEFGRPDPAATFMVRRFGDDLMEFLSDAGFAATRWDYTGRGNGDGDYFFLCEKVTAAGAVGADREVLRMAV